MKLNAALSSAARLYNSLIRAGMYAAGSPGGKRNTGSGKRYPKLAFRGNCIEPTGLR